MTDKDLTFKRNNLELQGNYTEQYLTRQEDSCVVKPEVNMTRRAFEKVLSALCSVAPESGGILLGPVGTNDIIDFYHDYGANVTHTSYSPDHITLSRKMANDWLPQGIDMKGFIHSHPGRLDTLTIPDLQYIKRLLEINPDMPMFVAPIVIPHEFRMRMMVVFRDNPTVAVDARINFLNHFERIE